MHLLLYTVILQRHYVSNQRLDNADMHLRPWSLDYLIYPNTPINFGLQVPTLNKDRMVNEMMLTATITVAEVGEPPDVPQSNGVAEERE
ncbi:hypothetical protein TNCV_4968201 [Trichonephila clavipes]|nr:hypothetical protein TNCV_4968201 [Trichonephila clavipes]